MDLLPDKNFLSHNYFNSTWVRAIQFKISEKILPSHFPVDVKVKTDLLHVYTNDVEDASPLELRSFNVELLQKKINDLEEENKHLHDEASQVFIISHSQSNLDES